MERYEIGEAAGRAGLGVDDLTRLVELGIVRPGADDRFTPGDVRRAGLVRSLTDAGVPLDGLGAAIREGTIALDFLDEPAYERFSAFSDVTFARFALRTGTPVQLLMLIREAAGSPPPDPDDMIRDEERPYAEFIAAQVEAGFRPASIEQLLRVQGDSLRRMADTETAWWRSEVMLPAAAAGKRPDEVLEGDSANRLAVLGERALIGMYHVQQMQAWTTTIMESLEVTLAGAGLHIRLEHPPAMCFLDITGYTRLTGERGDAAAAELAERLGRLVQRTSVKHGGRPVKWLGDGVMFFFPNTGPGRRGRPRDGGWRGRGRAAAGARRPARRAGHLPGGRLLRTDGERRLADRRVRATGRGPRQPGGGGRVGRDGGRVPRDRPGRTQGRLGRHAPARRLSTRLRGAETTTERSAGS